jgi:MFS family permease
MLGVAGMGMFASGPGQTYTVSLFVNPIIDELGWSRTTVSGLYTAGSLTAAATMFLVGRLLDRYGARVMLPVVVALFGIALIFMSNASQQWHLYAGFAAIRTLGQGSLTLIPTTVIAFWFVRLRGRVMALNTLGGVASQAAFPPLIHVLISAFGWRSAWVALAFIVWGLLLAPAILLVRRSPESVGLLPDGDDAPSEQQSASPVAREVNFTVLEALKTRAFWLLILAGSSQSLIGTALVFHHVSVMDSRGLDAVVAASALSVIAPGALLGTFLAGFLCDRFPNRFVLAGGPLILIFSMLITLVMAHPWQAIVYGVSLGLGGGIMMTTSAVIWPNYYGRKYLGSIRGVVTSGMVAAAALGPLPFGFLFDISSSYTLAVLIFLTLPVTCAIAAFMATPPQLARRA